MAWTANIVSKTQRETNIRVAVAITNGTTTLEREYYLGEADRNIDWLKLQINKETTLFDNMGNINGSLSLGSFDFSVGTNGTSLGTEV